MINLSKDRHYLTDFKRNTTEFVQRLKQTKHPVVLTVYGKAELVVKDAESYQKLLDAFELLETLKEIKRGLEQRSRGEGKKAEDFFAQLFDKLDTSQWVRNIKSLSNPQRKKLSRPNFIIFNPNVNCNSSNSFISLPSHLKPQISIALFVKG